MIMVGVPAKKLLLALSAGFEVSIMTVVGAFAGFAVGSGFGEFGKNLGLLIGAMFGFAMGVKRVIGVSAPSPDDEG